MPVPDIDTVLAWRGRNVLDRSGDKIGKFEDLYLDAETDLPEWAAVRIGRLGRQQALVPLSEAIDAGDNLQVPFDKEQVEAAPEVGAGSALSQEAEAALYGHYGLPYSKQDSGTGLPPGGAQPGAEVATDRRHEGVGGARERVADEAAAAPGVQANPGEMIRSEEEVVGVQRGAMQPRERVRLKKYIVTEHVQKTVPVQREEIRLEHDPPPGDAEDVGPADR